MSAGSRKKVDKHDIDECDLLNLPGKQKVTAYNDTLQTKAINDLEQCMLK